MFEALELGRKVTKEDFKEEEPGLHTALLATQRRIMEAGIPVIIIIAGVEGAGKGGAVNLLNKWLDTRGLETHAFWDEPEAARERPRFWRFWTALPARGQVGIMFGSWYTQTIIDRVFDRASDGDFERMLGRIDAFERMLIDDGALIVKFWLHLSKDDQQKRLARDVKEKRMTSPHLKEFADHYDDFIKVCERAIRATDSGYAPWNMVEARNRRFRDLTIGRALLSAMERRLAWEESTDSGSQGPAATGGVHTPVDTVTVLDQVDLSARLEREAYESRLEKYQRRLNQLAWQAHKQNRNTVLVFEGWDAAGKGGAIRRVTAAVDARLFRVISVAAPTDEELAHHYLWRFWRHIPRAGYFTIYDRSWYGRVLVERVEGFAAEHEWLRAYQEINDFEAQLADHGVVVCKFWLHISPEEQLRRFKEREKTPWKQHKITDEDWRNRDRMDDYRIAINDMVTRTSTASAPWTLVPANDKYFARVQVLKTICKNLELALD